MKSLLCVFSLLLLTLFTSAQTVIGKWYGIGNANFHGSNDNYLIEMILEQKGTAVSGEFNYYFKNAFFPNKISGSFDKKSRKLYIKTTPITYFRSAAVNGVECAMSGDFTLIASRAETSLSGKFSSSDFYAYTCPEILMNLKLSKEETSLEEYVEDNRKEETITPEKKEITTAVIPVEVKENILDFKKRRIEEAANIEVESSQLSVQLYDNGQVDMDSVSLYYNNKLLVQKEQLTVKGLRFTINVDSSIVNELSMFAENLGFIPPNTALMVIYDGQKRYEINLTSTLQTNGTVRIKKKKPKGEFDF